MKLSVIFLQPNLSSHFSSSSVFYLVFILKKSLLHLSALSQ